MEREGEQGEIRQDGGRGEAGDTAESSSGGGEGVRCREEALVVVVVEGRPLCKWRCTKPLLTCIVPR